VGATWHEYQIPALPGYRHTTFDNRGIGGTECAQPIPWTIADFARDTAELIEAVCEPPVIIAGLSMGAVIVLQLAIDRPDLVRCGISMGTAARAEGWLYDYMKAEVDLRLAGGELVRLLGATDYLAFSIQPRRSPIPCCIPSSSGGPWNGSRPASTSSR
jgi:pimeloyl-ACP methyl ester carboxylesterase